MVAHISMKAADRVVLSESSLCDTFVCHARPRGISKSLMAVVSWRTTQWRYGSGSGGGIGPPSSVHMFSKD
jgi:hypothetical protein